MTQEEEYTIRSQLKWKRDGSDWVLLRGRRRMGRVTPDVQYAGMWRSPKSGGRVSDMANLSWAKDAVMAEGIRETGVEDLPASSLTKHPSNSQQNQGFARQISSSIHFGGVPATPIARTAFKALKSSFAVFHTTIAEFPCDV